MKRREKQAPAGAFRRHTPKVGAPARLSAKELERRRIRDVLSGEYSFDELQEISANMRREIELRDEIEEMFGELSGGESYELALAVHIPVAREKRAKAQADHWRHTVKPNPAKRRSRATASKAWREQNAEAVKAYNRSPREKARKDAFKREKTAKVNAAARKYATSAKCKAKRRKQYAATPVEQRREHARAKYKRNGKTARDRSRRYYEKHKEAVREKSRARMKAAYNADPQKFRDRAKANRGDCSAVAAIPVFQKAKTSTSCRRPKPRIPANRP